MLCPVCNHRKAKRACPALESADLRGMLRHQAAGRDCVPAGLRISCLVAQPSPCRRSAPAGDGSRHDAAADAGVTERQARVFLMLAALTARHQAESAAEPIDEDIAQAAGALASTLETAARGIVYEHQPASLAASRLMAELKPVVAEVVKNAGSAIERDAAIALRRIEHGARDDGRRRRRAPTRTRVPANC